mmetsp:Transcript_22187/g.38360  ORF Transcript_22187/g.38360 Transcript_22187/m.38360 type:complete len:207 (-) Transcript_22187:507-1127(-)
MALRRLLSSPMIWDPFPSSVARFDPVLRPWTYTMNMPTQMAKNGDGLDGGFGSMQSYEKKDGVCILLDLPGVKKTDLEVETMGGNMLMIHAKRKVVFEDDVEVENGATGAGAEVDADAGTQTQTQASASAAELEQKGQNGNGKQVTKHTPQNRYSSYAEFSRKFQLPKEYDLNNVSCKLEDGQLKITVPRLAENLQDGAKKTIAIE